MHTIRTQLDYFHRVIPQLWDSFTVYALDLPGMGWSDIVPGARYEEPDLRAAVVEFVTGLDLHDVTLAGESLGGALVAARVRRPQGPGAAGSSPSTATTTRADSNGATCSPGSSSVSIRMPGLGPVFAAMENRPIMKGIMRGGVVDKRTLPDDFIVELRKSGRRKGYSRVARAIYRSLRGFVRGRVTATGTCPFRSRWSTANTIGHGRRSVNTWRAC